MEAEDIILTEQNTVSQGVSVTLNSMLRNAMALWRAGDKWVYQVSVPYQMFTVRNRLSIHHATFARHHCNPLGKITLLSHFTHEKTELKRRYVSCPWS